MLIVLLIPPLVTRHLRLGSRAVISSRTFLHALVTMSFSCSLMSFHIRIHQVSVEAAASIDGSDLYLSVSKVAVQGRKPAGPATCLAVLFNWLRWLGANPMAAIPMS